MRAADFLREDDPNTMALDLSKSNQKPNMPNPQQKRVSTGNQVKIALPGNQSTDAKVTSSTGQDVELELPNKMKIKTKSDTLVPNKAPVTPQAKLVNN